MGQHDALGRSRGAGRVLDIGGISWQHWAGRQVAPIGEHVVPLCGAEVDNVAQCLIGRTSSLKYRMVVGAGIVLAQE